MREQIKAFYLDYKNNYLTVSGIAQDHGITDIVAEVLIDYGRDLNEEDHG